MRFVPRFAPLPLAVLLTAIGAGFIVASPAGADISSETADACQAAFGGPTSAEVTIVTDPPARSDAPPGQQVRVDASWTAGAWESLSSVTACVRVNRVVNPALSASEAPGLDDGVFTHLFAVPDGLFNGTAICTRIRLAGDPVGAATEAVWMSKQACFEVHPAEEIPPTTATTTPPTTTPTTPAPAPAPAPANPQPAPAPPTTTGPATPAVAAPLPRPAAPPAVDQIPGEGTAGGGESPGSRVPGSESPGPVALPMLPRTGANAGGLACTGLFALAAGVPILARGRRRPRGELRRSG